VGLAAASVGALRVSVSGIAGRKSNNMTKVDDAWTQLSTLGTVAESPLRKFTKPGRVYSHRNGDWPLSSEYGTYETVKAIF